MDLGVAGLALSLVLLVVIGGGLVLSGERRGPATPSRGRFRALAATARELEESGPGPGPE